MKKNIDFESLYNTLFLNTNRVRKNTLGMTSISDRAIPIFSILTLLIVALMMMSGVALMIAMFGITDLDVDEMVDYAISLMFLTVVSGSLMGFWIQFSNSRKGKKSKGKKALVSPLVRSINPGFKYNMMELVPQNIFLEILEWLL